MIVKMLWTAVMLVVAIGILFFAAIGIDIPTAYYEKSEVIFAEGE